MTRIPITAAPLVCCLALGAAAAHAADYPSQPVEFVIPFAQGGGTDTVGRALAEYMKPHLGGDTYAANREGGGGAVGFRYGADAEPDGHTVTMLVTTLTVAPHTVEGYPVNHTDFDPICLISALPVVISVKADSEIETLEDLVAEAESRSAPMTFGTGGVATFQHLAGVAFARAADIDVRFVPYGGAGPILTAAYGGHIDVALSEASEVLPWYQDGRMKVLAVFGTERVPAFAEVPLASELGYPVDVGAFRGIGVPNGTPPEIKETLIEACRATTEDEAFVEHMGRLGIDVNPIFGEEFGDWLAVQHETFAEAARAVDLTE